MTHFCHRIHVGCAAGRWPLSTVRLTLRRVSMTDESAMWTYRQLEVVSQWGSWRSADQGDWRTLLPTRLRDALVIELDGQIIGDLMVRVEDARGQREVAEGAKSMRRLKSGRGG